MPATFPGIYYIEYPYNEYAAQLETCSAYKQEHTLRNKAKTLNIKRVSEN